MMTTRDRKRRKQILDETPAARFGRADEVDRIVVFLLGDVSHHMTGLALPVDGGLAL